MCFRFMCVCLQIVLHIGVVIFGRALKIEAVAKWSHRFGHRYKNYISLQPNVPSTW